MNVLVNPFRLNPDRENSSLKLKETRNPPEGRRRKKILVSGKIWCSKTGVYLHGLSRYRSNATFVWSREIISHKSVRS